MCVVNTDLGRHSCSNQRCQESLYLFQRISVILFSLVLCTILLLLSCQSISGSGSFCNYPQRSLLPKVPLLIGEAVHSIHSSLGPPESTSQMASRSVYPFLQGLYQCSSDRWRYQWGMFLPHVEWTSWLTDEHRTDNHWTTKKVKVAHSYNNIYVATNKMLTIVTKLRLV